MLVEENSQASKGQCVKVVPKNLLNWNFYFSSSVCLGKVEAGCSDFRSEIWQIPSPKAPNEIIFSQSECDQTNQCP